MSMVSAQSLFWIALGALFVPLICRRIHVPSAVGELIYGIIFGPHLLGLVGSGEFIEFMAHLGFAILMFSAGMEIDFRPIRKKGSKLLRNAFIWLALVVGFAVVAAYMAGLGAWPILAVCSVSIGLASVFLREKELLGSPLGQTILAAGLVGESASILFLTVLDFHHQFGISMDFFLAVIQFTGIFVLAYLLMRVFRFVIWWYPDKVKPFLEGDDPLELGVRMAVALLFIFVAAAVAFHVESILGAFIAGALFGFIFQEREVVAEKINALGQGFFVPFFFIVVGSHFDPVASVKGISWQTLVALIIIAVGSKIVPTALYYIQGLKSREILAAGLLFSAPLTLTVAVAEVGLRVNAISQSMQGSLILVAIALGLAGPYLARIILPAEEEVMKEPGDGENNSRPRSGHND